MRKELKALEQRIAALERENAALRKHVYGTGSGPCSEPIVLLDEHLKSGLSIGQFLERTEPDAGSEKNIEDL